MKRIGLLIAICSLLTRQDIAAQKDTISQRLPLNEAIQRLEKDIPALMKQSSVPGMSAALVRDGKLVWVQYWGVQNAETKEPVNSETIFEAASLSKVVTAYAALKLVDQGLLDLDVPLNKYLGNNYDIVDDPRIDLITARRVLTHSAGFPNWRSRGSKTLPINFNPGEKFSYSGEGFVYLSRVMEKLTNKPFTELIRELVFEPLGMRHSNFEWLDSYAKTGIYRHDWIGKVSFRPEEKGSNAAASLHTTADDYARFIIAILHGTGLGKKSAKEMLTPQIRVNEEKSPDVAWGIGVGLETGSSVKSFWHWGDQGDSKAYFTANLKHKDAIVYFTNSSNGLQFSRQVLNDAIGGVHPAIAYLDYPKYDPLPPSFYRTILEKGSAVAIKGYKDGKQQNPAKTLSESQINDIGYKLLYSDKVDQAIILFLFNTEEFPNSGNAWDSLAESYMINGENQLAIKYYEKAILLDPKNTNAVEQVKKLKELP